MKNQHDIPTSNQAFIHGCIERIQEAQRLNKLIVFIGSGVSINSGFPSWSDLIQEFAKDLGIKVGNLSMEDYLVIPQKYYNKFGQQDYNRKIDSIFGIQVRPNVIHEAILGLNPSHIITTNYDTLIEDSLSLTGQFYHTVAANEDLPYATSMNLLIKMHGDLKRKNLILKEDDYLCYSTRNILIENYVKSLFTTHTIIFIGFSANDPNFKMIFNSVKNTLQGNFQRAYLLYPHQYFNEEDFAYYAQKGINILYYKQIEEIDLIPDIRQTNPNFIPIYKENDRAYTLLKFIRYIINYRDKSNILGTIANLLRVFEDANYVIPEDIVKVINSYTELVRYNAGSLIVNEEIRVIEEDEPDNQYKERIYFTYKKEIDYIESIVRRAKINRIVLQKDITFELEPTEEITNASLESILNFDYAKLQENIKKTPLYHSISGNEQLYLERAFVLFKLRRYYESYSILKEVSLHAYRDKKYLLFFIAEFNKRIAVMYVHFEEFDLNLEKEELEELRSDIYTDIEEIFGKLQPHVRNSFQIYKKVLDFSFVHSAITTIASIEKKVKESHAAINYGGWGFNQYPENAKETCIHFWNYINKNFLVNDDMHVATFYQHAVRVQISSVVTQINHQNGKVSITPDSDISYLYIYLATVYFPHKELSMFLKELPILPIAEETSKKLFNSLSNLLDYYAETKDSDRMFAKTGSYINNCLLFISKIEISHSNIDQILDLFAKCIRGQFGEGTLLYIRRLFISKQDSSLYPTASLLELIHITINVYIAKKDPVNAPQYDYLDLFLDSIVHLLMEQKYSISDRLFINPVINRIKRLIKTSVIHAALILESTLFPLFPILGKNEQAKVTNITHAVLEAGWENSKSSYRIIHIIYNTIKIGVIENIDDNLWYKCLSASKFLVETYPSNAPSLFNDYEKKVQLSINLIGELILIDEVNIEPFLPDLLFLAKHSKFLQYILNRESYDYNNFQVSWLLHLSETEIKVIISNNENRTLLLALIRTEISGKESKIASRLTDILFNIFL